MKISGYVWCDFYGEVHEDMDDPHMEGPHFPNSRETWEPDAWTLRPDPAYDGELMFFKCPGQHQGLKTVTE